VRGAYSEGKCTDNGNRGTPINSVFSPVPREGRLVDEAVLDAYPEKSAGKKSGRLETFSLTPTQAILYFDSIAPGRGLALSFRLRAKYPIRAQTFASRVYEYYAPEISSRAHPVQLDVRKR
jgi:hypothetical protein